MLGKSRTILLTVGVISLLTACANLPGMHKRDVIQGNYIEEKRLNNIERGMNQHDVQLILGTPLVDDSYRDGVWYYVYLHHKSNGEKVEHRNVKIYFDGQNRVDRIEREDILVPQRAADLGENDLSDTL